MAIKSAAAAAKTTPAKAPAQAAAATSGLMTKDGLVDALAAQQGITKAAAAAQIDGVLNLVFDTVSAGREVRLRLGTFKLSNEAERTSRNPRTGEPVTVPARRAVRFAPSKALKAAVNGEPTGEPARAAA